MENVRISGNGTINGGEYNEVRVAGNGEVTGDIKAVLIRGSGNIDFQGHVECDDFDISGHVEIANFLKAKNVDISGHCELEGEVNADKFTCYGHCELEGDINADKIDVKGHGEFKNVYGDTIIMDYPRNKVEANEIEATSISLYRAEVNRVCGDNVKIVGISDVKVIEFKESLTLSKEVEYERIIKIENGIEKELTKEKLTTENGVTFVIDENKSGYTRVGKKIMGITPLLCVVAFLLIGFVWGYWHPGWLVFLLIPIMSDILKSRRSVAHAIKSIINTAVIVAYVCIGVLTGVWHPTWLMFFIIPITNIIVDKKPY